MVLRSVPFRTDTCNTAATYGGHLFIHSNISTVSGMEFTAKIIPTVTTWLPLFSLFSPISAPSLRPRLYSQSTKMKVLIKFSYRTIKHESFWDTGHKIWKYHTEMKQRFRRENVQIWCTGQAQEGDGRIPVLTTFQAIQNISTDFSLYSLPHCKYPCAFMQASSNTGTWDYIACFIDLPSTSSPLNSPTATE